MGLWKEPGLKEVGSILLEPPILPYLNLHLSLTSYIIVFGCVCVCEEEEEGEGGSTLL